MWLKAIAIAACLIPLSTAAQANADEFLEAYAGDIPPELKQQLARKLHDIQDGLGWANAALNDRHEEKLFCLPPNLAFADEQLVAILRDEVKAYPPLGKYPVGLVLLKGLERVFPCKSTPH
jgi:hypothetical protein